MLNGGARPEHGAASPTAQAFRSWLFTAHMPDGGQIEMNHQLRLVLQADHDTWVCEVGGWNGTQLNNENIARMRELLDDGVAVINARARRKEKETSRTR